MCMYFLESSWVYESSYCIKGLGHLGRSKIAVIFGIFFLEHNEISRKFNMKHVIVQLWAERIVFFFPTK